MSASIEIGRDDLSGEQTRELVRLHLGAMHEHSPPGHVFALDSSGLLSPDITVYTARSGGTVMGMGALRRHDSSLAEIKSMRTHPDHLRKGVATAILDHIVVQARGRGFSRLALETGSGEAFEPALALYRRRGFVPAPAFGSYVKSDFNQFLELDLT